MKAFIILVAALLAVNSAIAQDLLVKRNGEQMKVKVLKITKKKVQFVRHGTELPVYTLPISDIEYIEYPLGDRDTFGRSADIAPKRTNTVASAPESQAVNGNKDKWHGAVTPPNGPSTLHPVTVPTQQNSVQTYSIGDFYDKDGVKGIVALIYGNGEHGVVISLEEACLPWSTLHRKKTKATGANSKHDGEANMRAIEQYIAQNNLSWEDFPAFKWCRDRGEGWYLPSLNELWSAGTMYMGGTRTASNRKFRKRYNENMEAAGGVPLSNIMIYHSSTEDKDARYSYYSHMNSEPPYTNSGYKADDLFVRAFHKF